MNICVVSNHYRPLGGTEQYILSMLDSLEQNQHRTAVLTANASDISSPGRPVWIFPGLADEANNRGRSWLFSMEEKILEFNTDLLYLHNIPDAETVAHLASIRPSVRFIHDHGLICPRRSAMFPFGWGICNGSSGIRCRVNTMLRLCLLRPPGITFRTVAGIRRGIKLHQGLRLLVASHYMQRRLIQNGVSAERIDVLPYYCTYESCETSEWGNYVLFVGRMVPEKGLDCLLSAVRNWPESLVLKVAGDGPFLKKYQVMAQKMGLSSKVDILGDVPHAHLRELYRKCLALVVPSIWGEPFGIVGLEAMACGKPVVAFDVGGVSDWLSDGENGFLVPRKDIRLLSERICQLEADSTLAKKMGEAGRRRYLEKFSKDRHIRRLEEIFAEEKTAQSVIKRMGGERKY